MTTMTFYGSSLSISIGRLRHFARHRTCCSCCTSVHHWPSNCQRSAEIGFPKCFQHGSSWQKLQTVLEEMPQLFNCVTPQHWQSPSMSFCCCRNKAFSKATVTLSSIYIAACLEWQMRCSATVLDPSRTGVRKVAAPHSVNSRTPFHARQ